MPCLRLIVIPSCLFAAGLFAQQLPNFSLVDANINSMRAGKMVSPRDYLFQVSGYYFGSAG